MPCLKELIEIADAHFSGHNIVKQKENNFGWLGHSSSHHRRRHFLANYEKQPLIGHQLGWFC